MRNMVEDYSKANKKVHFSLDCSLAGAPSLAAIQSVALLVTAEFIDNALDAMEHKGVVSIDFHWERASRQLRIEVADDGPGVSQDMVTNLFRSGRSTKGAGRGMGLGLVDQACRAFSGTTHYSRDDGKSVLTATLRLPGVTRRRKAETA